MLTRFNADAAALLARIPETWALFDRKGFTEREESALRLLLEFNLIELQQTVRMQLLGDVRAVEADIQTTGLPTYQHLFLQMAPMLATLWGEAFTEDRYSQYRVGVERWRVTREGTFALEHWKNRQGPTEFDAVLFNEPTFSRPGIDAVADVRVVQLKEKSGDEIDEDAIRLEAAVQTLRPVVKKLGRNASLAQLKAELKRTGDGMNNQVFTDAVKILKECGVLEGGKPGRRSRKN